MKPKYIFTAVAAMCILMGTLLPHLGAPRSAVSAAPAPPAGQSAAAEVLPLAPTLAPAAAVVEQAAPEDLAAPEELAAAELPAAEELPVEASTGGDLPVFNPPTAVPGAPAFDPSTLPDLQAFAASLVNGQAGMLVGFYAPGIFALPVVQQPNGDDNFISDQEGKVTQFNRPSDYQSLGILAHNTLSGRLFFDIRMEDKIYLVYGDGRAAPFRVSSIQSYQALSPYDTHSDFVDLNTPEAPLLTHRDLFERVYTTPGRLVLQTCIEANGVPTWGRLFVIADPL